MTTFINDLVTKKGFAMLVDFYYRERGLKWPNETKAILFAITELGEMAELLVNKDDEEWVRNNPEDKEGWSPERFGEELGDVIMMCQVAGMDAGVDPMELLLKKMQRKLDEMHEELERTNA